MLITLTTTGTPDIPATDLGFLLHKHPDRMQRFDVSAGAAHVFYPVASPQECTAALLLDVEPDATAGHLDDRTYAAGSLLAVALSSVFGTAMAGRCAARPDLVAAQLPLVVRLPTLTCGGGADLVERLFTPLGWDVEARPVGLDPAFPEWGDSRYLDTTLRGTLRLADALSHLYVLLPVCSGAKHYPVGTDEVDKLLRVAAGWLPAHPDRELVTRRYLLHRRGIVRSALERLAESDDVLVSDLDDALAPARVTGVDGVGSTRDDESAGPGGAPEGPTDGESTPDASLLAVSGPDEPRAAGGGQDEARAAGEVRGAGHGPDDAPGVEDGAGATAGVVSGPGGPREGAPPLARQRHAAVVAALHEEGAARVLDLGCGGGALLRVLLDDPAFTAILGVDVSTSALEVASRRLRLDRMVPRRRERITVRQSALTYADTSLTGWDAAVLMEVIEHVDPERLPALEHAVFGVARPGSVLVTTPNVEYNVRFPGLEPGRHRHPDHRFEWTRAQFREWADAVGAARGYTVRHVGIGADDASVGAPTQMAVFRREAAS